MVHSPEVPEPAQSSSEEIANAVSHGLGLVAILGATPFLLAAAWRHGPVSSNLGVALFAGSAALLYLASMLYHAASAGRKPFFRMLDHLAIFFLIAGTGGLHWVATGVLVTLAATVWNGWVLLVEILR